MFLEKWLTTWLVGRIKHRQILAIFTANEVYYWKACCLQAELKEIVKNAQAGKLTRLEAADKILHIREEMDRVIDHLKSTAK